MSHTHHEFVTRSYMQPTKCAYCCNILALTSQGVQCTRCKVDVHQKCIADATQKFACLNSLQSSSATPMVRRTSGEGANAASYAKDASGSDADDAAISHSFSTITFMSPAFCCVCKGLIKGVYKQGVSCSLCEAAAHFKCQNAALSSVSCIPGRKRESGVTQLSNGVTQLGNAVMSMRRTNSGNASDGPQISGPTNFQHVAGATKGRTFVPLDQAQHDSRFKQEPVPATGEPSTTWAPSVLLATAQTASKSAIATTRPDENTLAKGRPSNPTDVVHEVHTNYNAALGEYEGLPAEWRGSKSLSALSFGSGLTSQPRVQLDGYSDRVPTILVLMARELRRRDGFKEEGLFRIAPSRTEQARVRALLCESSSEGNTSRALHQCKDTHVIAALMKEWCRMLDKSILSDLSRTDLDVLTEESFEEGPPTAKARENYQALLLGDKYISRPASNALLWILDLMAVVTTYRDTNKMGARAITTCFAPSIFVLDEPPSTDSIVVIKLITTLLVNALTFVQNDASSSSRDIFGDHSATFTAQSSHGHEGKPTDVL
ncbi:Rho GTPase-activating protein 2 [Hondaea fermentalgiana]|uniref:Rho GTPase-activating protein 2 n=1 Tax=Hondaea fermentalgiana TaxID=2315210 RepID=A0A2R5GRT3_9STRA|nr:Rho GTPase-activating protein 2 [Hondaea fermentalgiana]|eukprot:GBG32468.1 Rho GTPase-activating protein 2 [Hondaea fermentalgiana]